LGGPANLSVLQDRERTFKPKLFIDEPFFYNRGFSYLQNFSFRPVFSSQMRIFKISRIWGNYFSLSSSFLHEKIYDIVNKSLNISKTKRPK